MVKYNARVVGRVGEKRERGEGGDGKDGEWEAIGEEVVLVGKKDVWFQSEEEAVRWLRGEVGRVWREEGRGRGYLENGREGGWGSDGGEKVEEEVEEEEEEDGGWI